MVDATAAWVCGLRHHPGGRCRGINHLTRGRRRVDDVVDEGGVAVDGRRSVREEEELLVALVTHLHRRAGVNRDEAARRDVDALRRGLEQDRQGPPQRDEHFFLIRVDVTPAAGVRRITPHACAGLGELGGFGDRRLLPRLGAVGRFALLPLEVIRLYDVEGHGPTIPSGAMARPTYPRASEPLPAALPPAERTVGQLVAESIRFYGDHFRRSRSEEHTS